MKKAEDSEAFSDVGCKHDNPVAGLGYSPVHKSIIYFTIRLTESTNQQVIWQQNTQTQQVESLTYLKKPGFFLVANDRDVTFASGITLLI